MAKVLSYDEVAGEGLRERKKSFNAQCYCDVREFSCVATYLVGLGLPTPIRTSELLNEMIGWMSRMITSQGLGVMHDRPSEAIKELSRLGVSVKQLEDRRGRAYTRHLQRESLILDRHVAIVKDTVSRSTNNKGLVVGDQELVSEEDIKRALMIHEEISKESEIPIGASAYEEVEGSPEELERRAREREEEDRKALSVLGSVPEGVEVVKVKEVREEGEQA